MEPRLLDQRDRVFLLRPPQRVDLPEELQVGQPEALQQDAISAHPYARKRIDTLTQQLAKANRTIKSLKSQLMHHKHAQLSATTA